MVVLFKKNTVLLLFVVLASCGRSPYDLENYSGAECKYVDTSLLNQSTILKVPYVEQLPNYCGPASLEMMARYYGIDVDQETIGRDIVGSKGISSEQLRTKAYGLGLDSSVAYCNISNLLDELNSGNPVIVRVLNNEGDNGHFMVAVGYELKYKLIYVNDPADPYRDQMTFQEFENIWDIKTLQSGSNSHDLMLTLTPRE